MPKMNKDLPVPTPKPYIADFERLGFGLFVHWGLYAQLGEGEWIQHIKPIPLEAYQQLVRTFTAEDFDARAMAQTAKRAGARYMVLTTRHHDGFSLYDTRGLSDYDAPHSPAGRDVIAEYVSACRDEGIVPFFYHTTMDWSWNGLSTFTCSVTEFNAYLDYLLASVEVLCRHYGKIGGFWFDGNWCRPELDWQEDRLYGLIRKYQPETMIINNTGIHKPGELGHPEIDGVTFENQAAQPMDRRGHPKYVAGEMCQTMNVHWGIGKLDLMHKSPAELIKALCNARRVGANYLLNVGPTAQGAIPDLEHAILERVGMWVDLFGEAIFDPKPVGIKAIGHDFVLRKGNALYYFVHDLGIRGHGNVTVDLRGAGPRTLQGLTEPIQSVHWMDNGESLPFTQNTEAAMAAIQFTGFSYGAQMPVRVAKIQLADDAK